MLKTANIPCYSCFAVFLAKKKTLDNLFVINTCQLPENPYTAPPLTRHNGLQTGWLVGVKR
ncbi:MAG: hypothetical protein LDL43_20340, partial [Buttiauxella noackiae]|nr:hypothetical protein [Buttiauxella noackiae]